MLYFAWWCSIWLSNPLFSQVVVLFWWMYSSSSWTAVLGTVLVVSLALSLTRLSKAHPKPLSAIGNLSSVHAIRSITPTSASVSIKWFIFPTFLQRPPLLCSILHSPAVFSCCILLLPLTVAEDPVNLTTGNATHPNDDVLVSLFCSVFAYEFIFNKTFCTGWLFWRGLCDYRLVNVFFWTSLLRWSIKTTHFTPFSCPLTYFLKTFLHSTPLFVWKHVLGCSWQECHPVPHH